MTTDEKIVKDVLWGMYQENIIQGRHHETQRATVTGVIITFVGLLFAGISLDKRLNIEDIPFTTFLILIGCFGAVFSLKQYERYLLHTKRATNFRNELDNRLMGGKIYKLKLLADEHQKKEFPRLINMKLHHLWIGVNICVMLIGTVLTLIIL